MKMIQRNTCFCKIARLGAGFLAVLLLTLVLILPIAAEADEWELSKDGTTLTHGDESYEAVLLPVGYSVRPHTVYVYEENVSMDYSFYTVYANEAVQGIHWADHYEYAETVYLTREKLAELETFFDGEAELFYLVEQAYQYSGNGESRVDLTLVASLDAPEEDNTELLDVRRDLYSAPCYPLLAYDESATICFAYGAIYEVDGALYYVNYTELGNEYFDANGNFSYRSGRVEGKLLTGKLANSVEGHVNELKFTSYRPKYSFEEGDIFTPDPSNDSPLLFWGCYLLIGFLLPAVALIFGLILPRREGLGKPIYWYAMAVAAALWIVAALALLILLL